MIKFRTCCKECFNSWDTKTISQAKQIKSIHDAVHYIHNIWVENYS